MTHPDSVAEITVDDIIFNIEDYVGGNIEEVKTIDRMGFTVFLRSQLTALIDSAVREALMQELYDINKSFESRKSYRGYMVKQVISARIKWVSKNGKVHIGVADIGEVAAALQKGKK